MGSLYTVFQKGDTKLMTLTDSVISQPIFEIFHCQILQ